MKYLLILLFLFSTHSFSENINGKALYCNVKKIYKYDKPIKCSTLQRIDTKGANFCYPKETLSVGFKRYKAFIPVVDDRDVLKPKAELFDMEYGINHNEVFFG